MDSGSEVTALVLVSKSLGRWEIDGSTRFWNSPTFARRAAWQVVDRSQAALNDVFEAELPPR